MRAAFSYLYARLLLQTNRIVQTTAAAVSPARATTTAEVQRCGGG